MKAETIAKNKVKSMTIFSCPIENGERTGKRYKKSETSYDKKGNVIELIEYKQGKIERWEQYSYDNKNRVVEQTTFSGYGYDKSRFQPHKKSITYDSNNNDISKYKPIVETDKDGRKVETTFFLNGKLRSRRYFNDKDVCIEDIEYKNGTSIVGHKKFTDDGKLLSDNNFKPNGKLTNYVLCEYDDKGRLTRMKKAKGDGHIWHDRKLIYDDYDNLIDDIDIAQEEHKILNPNLKFSEDNRIGYRHKYFFNDKQLLTERQMYLGENLLMVYESDYTYEEK